MKTSMYLLGNAFRFNQQKAPDSLPTVQAAKAFAKDVEEMEKAIKKKNVKGAQAAYLKGLDVLDGYLDLVEVCREPALHKVVISGSSRRISNFFALLFASCHPWRVGTTTRSLNAGSGAVQG